MASRRSPLLDLGERRRELASLFSWAIPTDAALELLARYAPLVECGAGMGYWLGAAARARRGCGRLRLGAARTQGQRVSPRAPGGHGPRSSAPRPSRRRGVTRAQPASCAGRRYDDDAASYAVLRAYRGDVVIHIGERDEGATGSVRFHRELRAELDARRGARAAALAAAAGPGHGLPAQPACGARMSSATAASSAGASSPPAPSGAATRASGAVRRRSRCGSGRHRVEYPREVVDAMPPALRRAFEASPARIR